MKNSSIPESFVSGCNELLASKHPFVVSLVGAGGKTSTLFWLAREFARLGKKVMVTTTTRMYLPEENIPVILCHSLSKLPANIFAHPIVACFSAWDAGLGKVRGFAEQELDHFTERDIMDVLLVEADGARGFALKAASLHEPCIPESSRYVIAVTGGQVLGQPLGPQNVHRWPEFSSLTGLGAGDRFGIESLTRFINHPQGMFKNTPPGASRIWLINQYSRIETLSGELPGLLANTGLEAIWLGAVREPSPILSVIRRAEHHDY